MNLFTDDTIFARDFFTDSLKWQSLPSPSISDPSLLNLMNTVFKKPNNLYKTESPVPFWPFLLLVKHATESQFELLHKITRKGSVLPDGLICLAGSGSAFKGFRDRTWQATQGNIHISIHFTPNKPIANFFAGFQVMAALSVIQTLKSIPGLKGKIALKWVNDITINDAKVAGVLTKSASKGDIVTSALIGIGLNVNTVPDVLPDAFVPKVTSIKANMMDSPVLKLDSVLISLLDHLNKNYQLLLSNNYESIFQDYRKNSAVIGREVEIFSDPAQGNSSLIARGIVSEIGEHLDLHLHNQIHPIRSGRVVYL